MAPSYPVTAAPLVPGAYQVVLIPTGYAAPVDTTRRALNAIYLELGGNGIFYTVNYERFITEDISARVGFGYLSLGESVAKDRPSAALTSVPLMINYLGVGKLNHRLELGLGVVVLHISARASDGWGSGFDSGLFAGGTASIAYRYAPLGGGFNFKVAFAPLLASFGTLPTLGLGFGTVF